MNNKLLLFLVTIALIFFLLFLHYSILNFLIMSDYRIREIVKNTFIQFIIVRLIFSIVISCILASFSSFLVLLIKRITKLNADYKFWKIALIQFSIFFIFSLVVLVKQIYSMLNV